MVFRGNGRGFSRRRQSIKGDQTIDNDRSPKGLGLVTP